MGSGACLCTGTEVVVVKRNELDVACGAVKRVKVDVACGAVKRDELDVACGAVGRIVLGCGGLAEKCIYSVFLYMTIIKDNNIKAGLPTLAECNFQDPNLILIILRISERNFQTNTYLFISFL